MTKEKLAILSSYDELCGNASYTKALAKGLSTHFDVSIISLNVSLLRNGASKPAHLHIQEICEKLRQFDCVNIQFEAALFGSTPKDIKRHFFPIAKACRRLMLTLHRFQTRDKYPSLMTCLKHLIDFKIGALVNNFRMINHNNRYAPIYKNIIDFCKKRSIPILVHTKRDLNLINTNFSYSNVFDHPICYYEPSFIESLKRDDPRKKFIDKLSLDENKIYIGIFGFIQSYKGYETAVQALKHLPDKYELLILGAQHPQTIQYNVTIESYLSKLLKFIENLDLAKRVKFHRLVSDDDFFMGMMGCDFTILPYLEIKQGGSAVAALSLESGTQAIFSQNFAFFELEKYAPYAFQMFTIGNYLELANAISSYKKSNFLEHLKSYYNKYNMGTSADLYRKLLKQSVPIKNEMSVLSEVKEPS